MLAGCCKTGIVISRLPVVQNGLCAIFQDKLPDYEFSHCPSVEGLTLLQLHRADVIIAELSSLSPNPRSACEQYYSLITHYKEIHWIFLVNRQFYPLAVEYLMRPECTLLSEAEPVEQLIDTVRQGMNDGERISRMLLSADAEALAEDVRTTALTLSERQVLRLLAKGWGINQIAMLLRKSNKTVSAQKNSAMRRLSLRGNAEMYAWINSSQGMRELNLLSLYGEQASWKATPQRDMSLS